MDKRWSLKEALTWVKTDGVSPFPPTVPQPNHWTPFSRCFRTRGATPGFLDPLPKQEHSERKPTVLTLSSKCKTGFAKHNPCLQKVITNGNNTKAAILTSINYRFIKKILLFFSTDLLLEFFFFILLGSIWIYVTTIIREQQWMPALSVGDITT